MKKVFTLVAVAVFFALGVKAQAPQYIPWQAVIRDSSWNLIPNQRISLRFTVRDGSGTGTMLYQETDTPTTNKLGMVNLQLGAGTGVSGSFGSITWSSGSKYLQVEVDVTGGTSYIDMGNSQMMSVPYALYSGGTSSLTGTANGIPYYNSSGIGTSDPFFTRNSSTLNTSIMRSDPGLIEGINLNAGGVYISRTDSNDNHQDMIGEFYAPTASHPGGPSEHQMGVFCMRGSGALSGILLEDSNPVSPRATIIANNGGSFGGCSIYTFDSVFTGVFNQTAGVFSNGLLADTGHLHIISNAHAWAWPTSDGTSGQALTTDGSGTLSWQSASGGGSQPSNQVAYGTGSGITSDSLFTRNSSTLETSLTL